MIGKKILITGADGQLGNALRAASVGLPFSMTYTDESDLDITNAGEVHAYMEDKAVQYCINCAAYTNVDQAEDHQETAYGVNVRGAEHLARACEDHKVVLLHISTDFVFDGLTNIPYKELSEANPINTYGVTKLNGELMAMGNCDRTVVIRTSWLYSPYGHNFVKTILRLAAERDTLDVVYDQVGSPTYAYDLAAALLTMITRLDADPRSINDLRGVYHYANSGVCSWYDLAVAIAEIQKLHVEINPVHTEAFPTRAKRPRYSVLNTEKIRDGFGVSTPYWRTSLGHCLDLL